MDVLSLRLAADQHDPDSFDQVLLVQDGTNCPLAPSRDAARCHKSNRAADIAEGSGGHPLYLSNSWWRALGKWAERWSVGNAQRCPRSSSLRPRVEPSTYLQLSSAHWGRVSDRHA